MTRNSAGDRILWGAVDIVSGMLDPTEREAVRGDLIESGETGNQALLGVLGLLCRRQAALWSDWRPWLVLWDWFSRLGRCFRSFPETRQVRVPSTSGFTRITGTGIFWAPVGFGTGSPNASQVSLSPISRWFAGHGQVAFCSHLYRVAPSGSTGLYFASWC